MSGDATDSSAINDLRFDSRGITTSYRQPFRPSINEPVPLLRPRPYFGVDGMSRISLKAFLRRSMHSSSFDIT
jgi:hypothetical protein